MTFSPRYADTLQLLDGDTVVFDLNLPTGASNPSTLKTAVGSIDIGTPVPDREFFDDRLLVREDFGPTDMSLVLHTEAVDYELLQAGVGTLARLLKDPKHRIKWLREGASAGEERFIHFYSADVQVLGSEEAVLRRAKAINLQISIIREPLPRGPEATLVDDVAIPNDPADTNGKAIQVVNTGDAEASAAITITGDTGAKIQEVLVGVKSFADATDATDYLTETKFAQCEATGGGWTVVLGTDTASVVDTDASGGNAAETTHLATAGLAKRITLTRTTKLSSLEGTWHVYTRWGKENHIGAPSYSLQLRWGLAVGLPATDVEPLVRLDTELGVAAANYLFLKLGTIHVPENAAGLSLELWSQSSLNNKPARWDHLFLVPADRASLLSMMAEEGAWSGADLATPVGNPSGGTAGVVSGDSLILDTLTDNAGTTPGAGFTLAAGRHRVGFHFAATGGDTDSSVTVRVRNVTDTTTVTELVGAQVKKAQARSHYLEFDVVSGGANDPADLYQFQVDDPTSVSVTVRILRITHSFTPAVLSGESFLADGEDADKVDAAGKILAPAAVGGSVPLMLPPGVCVVALSYGDIPRDSFALGPENILTRDPTVTVTYQPRYLT